MDLEKNGALWKDLCRGGLVLAAQAGTAVWAGVCRAGQAAGCAARGVRLGLRFLELRAGVNTQMRTIGEMVYATHSGTPTPSADLQQALEAADQLHEALEENRRGLAQLRGAWVCDMCGAENSAGSGRCAGCGRPLGQ